MTRGRVIVAMSGGVDSSVAALLLHRQGYEVVGVTMRLWSVERPDLPPLNRRCCTADDVDDARRVCQVIGMPHYVLNFEREFQEHVVDYFVREYDRGRTPHPCLACNDKIKFDFLLRRAMSLEAQYVATGHYARIQGQGAALDPSPSPREVTTRMASCSQVKNSPSITSRSDGHGTHEHEITGSRPRLRLLKATDSGKDQSYVLFTLSQAELHRLLLPIGELPKSEVRRLAAEAGLPVADKPDSQDICFIPDGDYRRFVGERAVARPGELVDMDGAVLGRHPGVQFFTVGQRRGLGLNGGSGRPMFVARIEADTNRVVLGPEEMLLRTDLWASRVSFTQGEPPTRPMELSAKIRYKSFESPATVVARDGWAKVTFRQPQRAVTPGQAVVFYRGEEMVGGGYIELDGPSLN